MATRYKTYQMPYGFITIDSQTETPPEEYIAVFDVNLSEAEMIKDGATIEIRDNEAVVYLEGELS